MHSLEKFNNPYPELLPKALKPPVNGAGSRLPGFDYDYRSANFTSSQLFFELQNILIYNSLV